MQESLQSRW